MLMKCGKCGKAIPHVKFLAHKKACQASTSPCPHCGRMLLPKTHKRHRKPCRQRQKDARKSCKYCNKRIVEKTLKAHYKQCPHAPSPGDQDLLDSGAVYGYPKGWWSKDD